jgi:COMPASS component SWD3
MIYLLDYLSGKRVKTYKGHKNQKFCLFICFSGEYIVSGSEDNLIYIWDVQTKEILQKIQGNQSPVLCVDSFNNGKRLLASGSLGGEIKIWED